MSGCNPRVIHWRGQWQAWCKPCGWEAPARPAAWLALRDKDMHAGRGDDDAPAWARGPG